MRVNMVSKGNEESSAFVFPMSGNSTPSHGSLAGTPRSNRRQRHGSPSPRSLPHHLPGLSQMCLDDGEIRRLSDEKKKKIYTDTESSWKESIRRQMEEDLAQRVRDALETPPLEKMARKRRELLQRRDTENHPEIERLNAQFVHELEQEQELMKKSNWKSWRANRLMRKMMALQASQSRSNYDVIFKDELSRSNHASYPGVFGLDTMSEGMKDYNSAPGQGLSLLDKSLRRQASTKAGFLEAIRNGRCLDGSVMHRRADGSFVDKYGVVRTEDGPFWPLEAGPLFATPRFKWDTLLPNEPYSMSTRVPNQKTFDNQQTPYTGKWRGILIVYDCERSQREQSPLSVPEDCCPSLQFESRFECGNLRQARRVGQFEYELVLKTDLYTNRHTQWFYFRVQNAVPGVAYKFRIVNFLKKDSLYNHGMRPLMYSEKEAETRNIGWLRTGHHISYTRNVLYLHCPLLMRGISYHMLEWQMEFPHGNDSCYLAHCYPYTFTDLREDVGAILKDATRSECVRKEALCETRAGNTCFLLTVSDFGENDEEKKGVIITGRVHPGESNASWMMKGVLDFITGSDPVAKKLRKKFIFKIVPMLNPDGVIVGNYRCSLAARDLNRNYRHPRKDSFPTVWYTKSMIDKMAQEREIALYCDLHGHSRKHNVFMYGNNTGEDDQGVGTAKSFLNERIFPWLMSTKSPKMFTFEGCKFSIRKCKESTGRVVMWRQMRVLNSFTLEATFSGTTINKSSTRHFNVWDFREMGEVLVKSVLDYQMLQEDPRLHAMVIQQLTRYITRQILESRGFAAGKFLSLRQNLQKAPQVMPAEPTHFTAMETEAAMDTTKDGSKLKAEESVAKESTSPTKVTQPSLRIVTVDVEEAPSSDQEKVTPLPKEPPKEDIWKPAESTDTSAELDDVTDICDVITPDNMDDCLDFLDQLDVRHAFQDSDSSDSDSESEPEMKHAESKKKKKRKSKKQRDKDRQKREASPKKIPVSDDFRPKTVTLPAIPGLDANNNNKKLEKLTSLPLENKILGSENGANLLRMDRMKTKEPLYISKYEGRHNNGIPCFSEERSMERAAKRMAEVRKRKDDLDKEAEYLIPGVSPYQNFVAMVRSGDLQRAVTQDDIRHRLQVALHEGTPNVAQTLVGVGSRAAFAHPDEMIEIANIQPFNSTKPLPVHHYNSSSEDSDPGYRHVAQHHSAGYVHHQSRAEDREFVNNNNGNNTSLRRTTVPQIYTSSSAPTLGTFARTVSGFHQSSSNKSPPPFRSQLHAHPHTQSQHPPQSQHQPTSEFPGVPHNMQIYKHVLSNGRTDREKRVQGYRPGGTSLIITSKPSRPRRGSVQ